MDVSGYGVLDFVSSWFLVKCRHIYAVSSLMDTAYRMLEQLCHGLIACSIVRRSHALEKVIVTDLFYLKGMDVGSVNIHYLLSMYLRRFASGRKRRAIISRGQFVARLAEHFGLLIEQRL
nr:hypothetical protein [Tanacetum cinerariifolium]